MTVFCCTVCGSDMVCVLYNVMMVKMPVTWIVQQHSHMPALSLFKHVCPLCVLDPSLPDLSSCCNKLFCVKLYCTVGVSWVLVSRRLACIASILWAMQIIVFLTDVPCIFHIRAWLWAMGKKFFFFFFPPSISCRHSTIQCFSPPHTLYRHLMLIPLHAHFQPLSLKSMELILLGLMDFAAKVRRMHFNHGRS